MFDAYTLIKWVHVLLAIIAVGFNASYGIWLARAAKEPAHQAHVLRGIKTLDDRFANPAYALLLITGIVMVVISDLRFSEFWIAAGLVLYALVVILALLVYTPTLRRQIEALETGGRDSEEYKRLSGQSRALGIALAILVIAIVFLMVTKPTL